MDVLMMAGTAARALKVWMASSLRPSCGVAALLLCLAQTPPASAQESIHLVEQEIKAGLLYNFMKYTDWPKEDAQQTNAQMVVCLFGGDPFRGRLQAMAGRTVHMHVIALREARTINDLAMCSLIFVHADAAPQWPQLRTVLAEKAMLTVSDFPGFTEVGGMIEFTRMENRIGVKIAADAVMAAHLQVEDRLLKLANAIHTEAGSR
jgi:hypothetical protein